MSLVDSKIKYSGLFSSCRELALYQDTPQFCQGGRFCRGAQRDVPTPFILGVFAGGSLQNSPTPPPKLAFFLAVPYFEHVCYSEGQVPWAPAPPRNAGSPWAARIQVETVWGAELETSTPVTNTKHSIFRTVLNPDDPSEFYGWLLNACGCQYLCNVPCLCHSICLWVFSKLSDAGSKNPNTSYPTAVFLKLAVALEDLLETQLYASKVSAISEPFIIYLIIY